MCVLHTQGVPEDSASIKKLTCWHGIVRAIDEQRATFLHGLAIKKLPAMFAASRVQSPVSSLSLLGDG